MSLNPEFHEFREQFIQDKNKGQWDEYYNPPLKSDHIATKQEM